MKTSHNRNVIHPLRLFLILFVLLSLPASYTRAESTTPTKPDFKKLEKALDTKLPSAMKAGKVPGVVVAVGVRDGNGWKTFKKAWGNFQLKPSVKPMTTDTIFDLASMTKPIATGTSLMMLVDQGKVNLDDPVSKYLPEYNKGNKADVRVRDLMTHMSGLKSYIGAAEQKPLKKEHGFPCKDALRKHIRELPLSRDPRSAVVYSCLNAITCAEIVRTVSGEDIDVFSRKHIYEPLGMEHTMYNPPKEWDALIIPTTVTDYGRGESGFLCGQVHDPLAAMQEGISGNAGLFSNVDDLGRFCQMMLNDGVLDGVRILKPATVAAMTAPQNTGAKSKSGNDYPRGLLWGTYIPEPGNTNADVLRAFGHTGYTGQAVRVYPEQDVYVLVMTNRVHPDDTGKVGNVRQITWDTVADVIMGVKPGTEIPADKPAK